MAADKRKQDWYSSALTFEEAEYEDNVKKIKALRLPILPNVIEAMAREGLMLLDLYDLVKSASDTTIRKLIYGRKAAYDENGEPDALAQEVADVLFVPVEDLFGPSPKKLEGDCDDAPVPGCD